MTSKNTPSQLSDQYLAKYTMSVTVMMTGAAAHKIRRLEVFGLCNPVRTESGQRLYSDQDIEMIKQVVNLQNNGVNLPGIKIIMDMKKSGNDKGDGK